LIKKPRKFYCPNTTYLNCFAQVYCMSFIEQKEKNGEIYAYFVKKFPFMGKHYKINKYIGKNPLISKEDYIRKNLEKITLQELEIKKKFFPKEMVYGKLLEKTEKNAIYLNNLMEARQNHSIVEKEIAKEFVFNSNNIEGSKLPRKELEKIFENKKSSYANKNEILEAENSIKAFKYLKKGFYFSAPKILKLYRILTKELTMETGDKYAKGFRKTEIVVGNEKTTEPERISQELKNLLEQYKKNKRIYGLKQAFDFHLKFESIHPFRDANGRTGRLIMNKILLQNNYPLMLVFKDNKKAYFNSIKKAREGKNRQYYQFMMEQQLKSYKLTKKIAEK